jgi:DnaJ-class molecular chaperone
MACYCVICPDCNGSGNLWQTLDGKIHRMRRDDMGQLLTCDTCRGSGRSQECEECFRDEDFSYT